jgi:hypothetical protein
MICLYLSGNSLLRTVPLDVRHYVFVFGLILMLLLVSLISQHHRLSLLFKYQRAVLVLYGQASRAISTS